MHGRKYRNAARTCDVIFANSAFTADDIAATLGFPRERDRRRASGDRRGVHAADGPQAELGGPYLLTVATLEPRKNLGTLVEAFALLERHRPRARRRRRERAGASSRSSTGPGIVRLGRVDDDELARLYRGAAVVVYPSRFEGFGMPITEAMASRRARRRLGAPVAGRGVRRRRGARPTRRAPRRSPRRSARRSTGATSCARAGSRTLRSFSWRRDGELFLEGYRAILVAHRHDAAPPDARRHRALPARAARRTSTCDVVELSFPATSRLRTVGGRRALVPAAAGSAGADVLHCPTFRGPFRSTAPLVVTVHDLAVLRHPEWFNRWTRTYSRLAVPRVVARGDAGDRRLRVHAARARRPARRRTTAKIRVVPNAVEDVFTPGRPARRGRLRARGRDARAAQEPRADRRRGRRRAARRRRARLGRRRAAGERRPGSASVATTSSPRSTAAPAASSTRRSTRASASRSPRRSPAAARS